MQVRSLGWDDLLEKGMATHSSILAWRTRWTEEPDGLQSMGSRRIGHWATNTFRFSLFTKGQKWVPGRGPRTCKGQGVGKLSQIKFNWLTWVIKWAKPPEVPCTQWALHKGQQLYLLHTSVHTSRVYQLGRISGRAIFSPPDNTGNP